MFIYVDESGSFVPAHSANSWNVVAAYAVSEPARRHAETALLKLKFAAGCKYSDEVKLKDISESQLVTFLDDLSDIQAIAFASCINLGTQKPEDISAHQLVQVEANRFASGQCSRDLFSLRHH